MLKKRREGGQHPIMQISAGQSSVGSTEALLLGKWNGQFHVYLESIFTRQEECIRRREKHPSLCSSPEQRGGSSLGPGRRPTSRMEGGMFENQLEGRRDMTRCEMDEQ